jgi:hypothetical protein
MYLLSFFSSNGMDEYPTKYLFHFEHFLYFFLCIAAFFILMKLFVHTSEKTRKRFVSILLILMLLLKYGGEAIFVSEYYLYPSPVSSFTHPFLDYRTFFSFQMCGVNNVLLPLVIWLNFKPAKDFVYVTSIIGGLAVLIYPSGVLYGSPLVITFPMLRSLIVHFLLVFVPCFLMYTSEFKLESKNWKNTLYGAILISIWSMYGNIFVDPSANNMYLMINPFFGGPIPILNIIPNGYHVIVLLSLVFLGFLLVYYIAGKLNKYRDIHPYIEKSALC